MAEQPRPFVGLLAGVAAGLVAAAAMAAFQSQAGNLLPDDSEDAPMPVQEPVPEATGQMVQIVVGAVMGGIYGVLTEYRPEASAGFGSAYGIATATLLEEATAPDLDAETPESNIYGVASHLVFGIVLEGVRRLIAGRR